MKEEVRHIGSDAENPRSSKGIVRRCFHIAQIGGKFGNLLSVEISGDAGIPYGNLGGVEAPDFEAGIDRRDGGVGGKQLISSPGEPKPESGVRVGSGMPGEGAISPRKDRGDTAFPALFREAKAQVVFLRGIHRKLKDGRSLVGS